jgi:saccharopine dehydrogenase-like NADP-dependent oxidoreductase
MTLRELGVYDGDIPKDAVFIIGAGRFGIRAAQVLSKKYDTPLFIVDVDKDSLSKLESRLINKIHYDGIHFLVKY